MGMISEVRARFTAVADGFTSTVNTMRHTLERMPQDSAGAFDGLNNKMNGLMGTIGKVGAAYVAFQGLTAGLTGLAGATIGANADMETYENTLTTVLKSHDKAKETLDWATSFAASTPFEIPEIVEGTAKLSAYGITASDVMTDVGNMAAVMGLSLIHI